jgi:hypothetical protein
MPRAATMIRAIRRAKAEASAKPIVGAAENATLGPGQVADTQASAAIVIAALASTALAGSCMRGVT